MKSLRIRIRRLAATAVIGAAAGMTLGFLPAARAAVVLVVNVDTGDLQLVGQPGDTLSSYVIKTSSGAQSFLSSDPSNPNHSWEEDRFGGTPVGAATEIIAGSTVTISTSIAAGNGTWHNMGTSSSSSATTLANGQKVIAQLGEMCAVWGEMDGAGDIRTPVIYDFTTEPTTIDLGDHFIPGSATDLLLGYGTYPGLMNTQLFSGSTFNPNSQSADFTGSSYVNTAYYGQKFSGPGVLGTVEYTPEPASIGLLALGGTLALLRRRRIA
jgi:hypothetical protein